MIAKISIDGTNVQDNDISVHGDKLPDVLRIGDGTLFILYDIMYRSGAHYHYRKATVHDLPWMAVAKPDKVL